MQRLDLSDVEAEITRYKVTNPNPTKEQKEAMDKFEIALHTAKNLAVLFCTIDQGSVDDMEQALVTVRAMYLREENAAPPKRTLH